ncbi:MAG TPA: ClC family H(+)/Cl(-) exchange transporter [Clostridia bacterium]|nr:ClC family H(+)/Cl(-) exchange transporter [Clostridia bacterium]
MQKPETKVYKLLTGLDKLKWNIAVKGIICGAVAGLLAVGYRVLIEYGTETSVKLYAILRNNPFLILPWLLAAAATGLFIAWIVRLEPAASGSGIPQVKGVVLYGMKMKWYTILAARFVGGALGAFFGLSLGREGPSIQIGAAGAQMISRKAAKDRFEENYLITGGAAAGLSAAFNAPLSGIVFALEEIHRSFSPLILIAATTSSLTADLISKYFLGLKPVLSFTAIKQWPVSLYIWIIPLGLVSGFSGILINKALLGFQTLYGRLPEKARPVISLLIALPFGLLLPEVLGGGHGLVGFAETARSGLLFLFILYAAKILFTSTSFGSGIPGGVFLPILSIGALSGSITGMIAVKLGMPESYISGFAVCAMAGALAGAVKAPVTSILLAAEMTGSLVHLMPVAACSFIAMLFSDVLKVSPLYDELLERFAGRNGHDLTVRQKGGLLEIPVEYGSKAANCMIRDVEWPQGALIVAVKRGDNEIIPNGGFKILPGDYLVILSEVDKENQLHENFKQLCRS